MSEAILLSLDPVQLSPEERVRAVAAIFTGGLHRLRKPISGASSPFPDAPGQFSRNLSRINLLTQPTRASLCPPVNPPETQRSQALHTSETMEINVGKEIAALQRMGVAALRRKYAEVFGEVTTTGNRTWLVRRIAWRIQTLAEGDLSERARQRATELARDADIGGVPPREKSTLHATTTRTITREVTAPTDGRLPPPGSIITRKYKGGVVQVKVLARATALRNPIEITGYGNQQGKKRELNQRNFKRDNDFIVR